MSRLVIAWLQLLRLPNVFTAVADVMMGYLVTHGDLQPAAHFALLVAASCLLYLSGMVLNDVFDAEVDAREQPERPIPSGRVSLRRQRPSAGRCWPAACWSHGLRVLWRAIGGRARSPRCLPCASCCTTRVLKRTPLAPLVMGACRMLNVLLGMSLAPLGH